MDPDQIAPTMYEQSYLYLHCLSKMFQNILADEKSRQLFCD